MEHRRITKQLVEYRYFRTILLRYIGSKILWCGRSKEIGRTRVSEVTRNSDDLVSGSASFYWPLETPLLYFRSGVREEQKRNVLLLIRTPRPMISTPSNSRSLLDRNTVYSFLPYSALIDRGRYTKLPCSGVRGSWLPEQKRNFTLESEPEQETFRKRRDGTFFFFLSFF